MQLVPLFHHQKENQKLYVPTKWITVPWANRKLDVSNSIFLFAHVFLIYSYYLLALLGHCDLSCNLGHIFLADKLDLIIVVYFILYDFFLFGECLVVCVRDGLSVAWQSKSSCLSLLFLKFMTFTPPPFIKNQLSEEGRSWEDKDKATPHLVNAKLNEIENNPMSCMSNLNILRFDR